MAKFTIIGPVTDRDVIASGRGIHELARIQRDYGRGNWRKCKGRSKVESEDGKVYDAEIHWYEAHGIGKRDQKVKRLIL